MEALKQKAMKWLSWLLVLSMAVPALSITAENAPIAEETQTVGEAKEAGDQPAGANADLAVLEQVVSAPAAEVNGEVVLTASHIAALQNAHTVDTYQGNALKTVIGETDSTVTYTFTAPAGLYRVVAKYYPVQTNNSATINRDLSVNGDKTNVKTVGFQRRWVDDVAPKGTFDTDSYGHQIRPLQKQEPSWMSAELYASDGNSLEPIQLQLQNGINTLTIYGEDDSLAIESLRLIPYEPLHDYQTVKQQYAEAGYQKATGVLDIYEAEHAAYKSDSTLYPTYERASASVTPHDPMKQVVNVIGGSGWSYVGQYVAWNIHVEEAGLYAFNFKYRKNINQGMSSYRRLYIDGVVPFAEANSIEFAYTSSWANCVPGGEESPYLFYLDKGDHELKLEVSLGEMTSILEDLSDLIYDMNGIYRRIIVVTGASPDFYRDYDFETILPDVVADLRSSRTELQEIYDRWFALVGEKGSTFSTLDLMLKLLEKIDQDPELIAKNLAMFKSHIGSIGTLLNNARTGQLELDTITVFSPDSQPKPATCGFFEQLWFSVVNTFSSYVTDYNNIGTINSEAELTDIRVWVTTGRDQYELLKNMANNGELEEKGIKANMQLVSASLLQAIIAGTAPDVQLTLASSDLINYALRGAIVDVSKFSDFSEVANRFYSQTFVPLTLEGTTYGLPVTMNYEVLFYRTDILSNLGIDVPETWDDVTRLITILNKNNLEFGLPAGNNIFYTLLMQNGGKIYNEQGSKVAFDDQKGIDAFIKWTRYFTDYGQPKAYDAQNRFRSGEMPILIADYSLYNTLAVAAPEIDGLWSFSPLPGSKQADGSVVRTTPIAAVASAIIKGCKDEEAAWEFLKWWTSSEVQMNYGRGQESIMGSSSRYATANLGAMKNLPWTASQQKVLLTQLNYTKAVPEVPGGYLTTRQLTYAFHKVVNQGADAKDTLLEYIITINNELTAKREEFGLETAKEVK